MTNRTEATERRAPPSTRQPPVGRSASFDWVMIVLGGWLLGGLYLDSWAHHHRSALETFFTPWHGVFHSGFAAVVSVTAGTLLYHRAHGAPWRSAVPPGYGLSLVGAGIFAVSGVEDLIWHLMFGIEVRMEALHSPTI